MPETTSYQILPWQPHHHHRAPRSNQWFVTNPIESCSDICNPNSFGLYISNIEWLIVISCCIWKAGVSYSVSSTPKIWFLHFLAPVSACKPPVYGISRKLSFENIALFWRLTFSLSHFFEVANYSSYEHFAPLSELKKCMKYVRKQRQNKDINEGLCVSGHTFRYHLGGQLASDETNQQQNQKLPQQHAPRKKLGSEGIIIAFYVKE